MYLRDIKQLNIFEFRLNAIKNSYMYKIRIISDFNDSIGLIQLRLLK